MLKYRTNIIDWNYKNGKIINSDFANGIKELRKKANKNNFKLHYSRNTNCWIGYNDNLEFIAISNKY